MTNTSEVDILKPVRYLKGIGPKKYELLKKLGIETVRDLYYYFPRRYEDRSSFQKISEFKIGSFVSFRATVVSVTLKSLKRLQLIEVWLKDESGIIPALWFNQPYLKNVLQPGQQLILSGKVDHYRNSLQMTSPEYEILDSLDNETIHTGRITPIYPLTEGLFQRSLRSVLYELVQNELNIVFAEFLPQTLMARFRFLELAEAIREIHFPSSAEKLEKARERLIFDEFFTLEIKLLSKLQETRSKHKSIPIASTTESYEEFKSQLNFHLTDDQETVIQDISKDISSEVPMHRLLQGEVGSGKTVVAAYFLELAVKADLQAVFLIPTEILAEQHDQTIRSVLKYANRNIELLTASVGREKKEQILNDLAAGKVDILIGTHAVLQEDVFFRKLGLVIIDEQHKFGVKQRAKLLTHEPRPHLLIMSATPIPRTLGLTLYGDLDISTIRMLPKGRNPVETFLIKPIQKARVFQEILKRIQRGEQAYILFPAVEENEKIDLQAAVQEFEKLKASVFESVPIGLVHGRLEKNEREKVMKAFQEGRIKVLVATSVIEVGVDNPNATMMVIENAERFGLSQLHQIRGRIGRGTKASVCYLISDPKTDEAKKRLKVLTKTSDGFEIAEEDLKLRGPGEFFGFRQSGIPPFKIADLIRDKELLIKAREEAEKILMKDPLLSKVEHAALRVFR